MSNTSNNPSQIISLPKGGGALHGIGEKFSPDLHTGTGNFTIPIALPPGRNGFQPQLSLGYSTGNGQGPFGLGWGLSIPGVSRKTSHGIPRYNEAAATLRLGERRDVFILSGSEDLVPVWGSYPGKVQYRPRTEGLFALIEHYPDAANNHWKVSSKDGLISYYGKHPAAANDNSTVVDPDPANPKKIFAWKLTETRDPFGNRIVYEYERDTGTDGPHQFNQVYLKSIRYVDYTDQSGSEQFLVSVTFDYDEERLPNGRPGGISDYRAGFEIRTRRRCKQILIRTHPEGAAQPISVRAYEFHYEQDQFNDASLLKRVEVVGFDDAGREARELPPLEFGYTRFEPEARKFEAITGSDLPARSLANPELDLVDLFGNGLPDVLEMNGSVRYWRNLGGGQFDLPRPMRAAPPYGLSDPGVQMIDANGDGRADLLVTTAETAGYYPLDFTGQFSHKSYQPYQQAPSFNLKDPEVRFVDLTGDGITDALRSGTSFECYFNDPQKGWLPGNTARIQRTALPNFPNVSFSDPRVKWADMSGDGMQDVVLVHDVNIEYWPNLGYGRWGKRIHMFNSPRFRDLGYTFGYDPKRILIGDVDGDGLADIVYVSDRKVTLWINQSGNAWSDPIEIQGTPPVTDMDAVRLTDLFGAGLSGVLWSADAQGNGRPHLFFLDFTGGVKPYLLNEMDNNIGAVTTVQYAPSTKFYLRDAAKPGTRWKTTLPFPVQVVERVTVTDKLSSGSLTTEYRYHHGYWDGVEREFRGFGMVEQLDREVFDGYIGRGLLNGSSPPARAQNPHLFSPPLLTRTWFHQGPVDRSDDGYWIEIDWSKEYWSGDPNLLKHTDKVNEFLDTLPPESRREALRTLRGSILRSELYALDGSTLQDRPYTVSEHAYGLKPVPGPTRPPIFFPHAIAQRTTQWERGDDPMTAFSFTSDYDDYGQPRQQTTVAMPRRAQKRLPFTAAVVGQVQANETRILATHNRTTYAEPDQGLYVYNRAAEARAYELSSPPEVKEEDIQGNDISAKIKEVLGAQCRAAKAIRRQFEQLQDVHLIGHALNYYDGLAFVGRSDRKVGPYGALTRSETLVFRDEELNAAYGDRRPTYLGGSAALPNGAPQGFGADLGYRRESAAPFVPGYYIDTQRQRYDFQEAGAVHRGIVTAIQDPRGNTTIVQPDKYWLLPELVRDAAGLETIAVYNYRVMQPARLADPNDNATYIQFSPAGLVTKQWLFGNVGRRGGTEQKPEVEFTYDFLAYARTRNAAQPQPISAHAKQRIWHASDNRGDELIEAREYSDGFGRLLQKRAQAEELVFGLDPSGDDVGLPAQAGTNPGQAAARRVADRVVVSGWQIYDNKGRVVEKYEPFFDDGWAFQPEEEAKQGQHVEMYYDPRGQVIRTLNPDGSEQRVVYGIPRDLRTPHDFEPTPWEAYTYDANDLASITTARDGTPLTGRAPDAHHFTPANVLMNAQGKAIAQIVRSQIIRNGSAQADWHLTRSRYDVRGNLIEIVDALGRTAFHHAYDLLNRPLRVESIDAGLRTSVLDALGNLVEYRDSKGAVVLHLYDILNRPKEVWARNDATGAGVTLRERIVYGDSGSPAQPEAERNMWRQINTLGKPIRYWDEAGYLRFFGYDFKGNLLGKMRQVISDATLAAIPTGEIWIPDWSQPNSNAALETFEYHTNSTFDALNRPTSVTYPQDAEYKRRVLRPRYNRAGALESVALFESATAATGDDYVKFIAYNAKGQRVLIEYGNGLMTRYAYDPQTFRLARLRTERLPKTRPANQWHGAGDPLQDFTYGYDLAGNILTIDERVPNCGVLNSLNGRNRLERKFTYDPIYRLLSGTGRACKPDPQDIIPPEVRRRLDLANCGSYSGASATPNRSNGPDLTEEYKETFQYDPAGNMLELAYERGGIVQWKRVFGMGGLPNNQWPSAPNNRLTSLSVGQDTFTYIFDDNGNLKQQNTERFHAWDHADRMVGYRVQAGAAATTEARYLYGADGIRVRKWVRANGNGESTVYIDDVFEHQNWRKNGQAGQTNHLHVMDNQSRVALVRLGDVRNVHPDDQGPAVQYHLGDHLESNNIVVGGPNALANAFINREEFFPYGETSFGSFGKMRYRFMGKEKDEESGLNYHGTRYFAPWMAGWASCDPLGMVDGLNLYRFTRNNPLSFADPSGTQGSPVSERNASDAEGLTVTGSDSAGRQASQVSEWNPSDAEGLTVTRGDPNEASAGQVGKTNLVYSRAPGATKKREIDKNLAAEGVPVKMNNPGYWSKYIKKSTNGRVDVDTFTSPRMVFIENGGEGFLQKQYAKLNADALNFSVVDQQGMTKQRPDSDVNDVIILYGAKGEFLGAYQLITSNAKAPTKEVISSWDAEKFGVTYNNYHGYQALKVFDPYRGRAKDTGRVVVDIHKFYYTAGCIEISPVDSSGRLMPVNKDSVRRDFASALNKLGGPSKDPIGEVILLGYGAQEKRDPFRPSPGYRR